MKRNHGGKKHSGVRMELKYCEHCGGLWVREGGGGVYCDKCQGKISELPIPKKKPGKVMLPAARRTVIDGYEPEPELEQEGGEREFEAAGGVA
jgi:hypothetical protein